MQTKTMVELETFLKEEIAQLGRMISLEIRDGNLAQAAEYKTVQQTYDFILEWAAGRCDD